MKIIAERKWEMKRKTGDQDKGGGNNMKKLAIIAVLAVATLISTSNAFAHWKAPASLVLQDPAPCPFDNKNF